MRNSALARLNRTSGSVCRHHLRVKVLRETAAQHAILVNDKLRETLGIIDRYRGFHAEHPSVEWRHNRFPKLVPKYRCDSVLSVAGAVVAGLGIGVALVFLMNDRAGVEIVERPLPELEADLWMLAHPDSRQLQRVRVMFDFFREKLKL